MSKADTPQRWFHGWRASAPPPLDLDAADLGTAFGLDLSLNELHHEAPRPPAAPRQPGWMSRLAARRKSAA
jgi:hypothetical protein